MLAPHTCRLGCEALEWADRKHRGYSNREEAGTRHGINHSVYTESSHYRHFVLQTFPFFLKYFCRQQKYLYRSIKGGKNILPSTSPFLHNFDGRKRQ
jgi:hypothetical protein